MPAQRWSRHLVLGGAFVIPQPGHRQNCSLHPMTFYHCPKVPLTALYAIASATSNMLWFHSVPHFPTYPHAQSHAVVPSAPSDHTILLTAPCPLTAHMNSLHRPIPSCLRPPTPHHPRHTLPAPSSHCMEEARN